MEDNLNAQVEATGFFKNANVENKWWFVDPRRCYRFIIRGRIVIASSSGGMFNRLDKRTNFIQTSTTRRLG